MPTLTSAIGICGAVHFADDHLSNLFLYAAIPIRLGHVFISGKRLWSSMREPAITDDDRERIREFLAKPFLRRHPDDLREETDDNE